MNKCKSLDFNLCILTYFTIREELLLTVGIKTDITYLCQNITEVCTFTEIYVGDKIPLYN